MTTKSHLTAIARTKLSAPCRYLNSQGLLVGSILDYGCGRGFDRNYLGCDGYDPYYFPTLDFKRKYDTIYSNFVLNVIEDEYVRSQTIECIKQLLKKGGKAYITVRRDNKRLNGLTSRGTWQGFIELDLPIVYEKKGQYIIYVLTK